MSVAYVGVGAFASANATSITPAIPAGTQEDDLLLLFAGGREDVPKAHVTAPSGWTEVGTQQYSDIGSNAVSLQTFYRWQTATPVTAPTFADDTATSEVFGFIAAYRGVNTTTPFDISMAGQAPTTASLTLTQSSITTVTNWSMALSISMSSDDNNLGLDVGNEQGFTLRAGDNAYDSTAGLDASMMLADKLIPTAGTVTMPTLVQTVNGPDRWATKRVALRPAVASFSGIEAVEDFESGTDTNAYTTTSGLAVAGSGTGTGTYASGAALEGSLGLDINLPSSVNLFSRTLAVGGAVSNQMYGHVAIRGDAPASGCSIAQIWDASATLVVLRLNADGTFTIRDNNTNRATTTRAIHATTWTQIGFGWNGSSVVMKVYDGAGSVVESEVTGTYSGGAAVPVVMRFGIISTAGTGSFNYDFDWVGWNSGEYVTPFVAGGQTVALGTATEADSATGLGKAKTKAVGAAAETDSATGVAVVQPLIVAVGTATETDTATGVGKKATKAVGTATETDTATGLAKAKVKVVSSTAETDSATGLGRKKSRAVGAATETDAGVALGRKKSKSVGAAAESDSATGLGKKKSKGIGAAAETDTAVGISASIPTIVSIGTATETDTAVGVTVIDTILRALGTATETDSPTGLGKGKSRPVGVANETDTATGVAKAKRRTIGAGAETDTATGLGKKATKAVGTAAETDTAVGVGKIDPILVTLGTATETDTAIGVVLIGQTVVALGTATSSEAAVSLGKKKSLAVGAATESDAATGLTAVRTVALGTATETDSAGSLGKAKSVSLGNAPETDTAKAIARPGVLGLTYETDTAIGVSRVKTRTLGTATSTEIAVGVPAIKRIALGVAYETDTAWPVTQGVISRALGVALELEVAGTLTRTYAVWQFTPPVRSRNLDPGPKPFNQTARTRWRLYKGSIDVPISVLIVGDTVREVRNPVDPDPDLFFQGGRVYTITADDPRLAVLQESYSAPDLVRVSG